MKSACAALLVLAMGMASAQTVYRCGPDGRQFSQQPCAGGAAVDLKVDRPDESERQRAKDLADRDRALGERLEAERLQREEREQRSSAVAGGFHPRPPKPAASAAAKSPSAAAKTTSAAAKARNQRAKRRP